MHEVKILLIEDNDGDIVLTLEALYDARLKNEVKVIKDGAAAIEFFASATKEELPDLILLDINLPKIDGKEVLQYVKSNPELKRIPVVMLTTSSAQSDITDSYNGHANCYITKPVDLNKFFDLVKVIEDFWITIVKLPGK
ncbi:response regulator [Segetibacter sp. 3557_3]|uniref:response regulator n=1 Tax=Segetibacter sp. 3557_3 TaxID=2547429 RepID=UPI001058BD1F|nr:response regulator [Segetibacter sp. 3557_3]TDH28813.1 response regulator [Segetibacter sp. 3557_3]